MTQLKRFDPHTASEAEFEAYAAFFNELRAESDPDDPPLSQAYLKQTMQNIPASVQLCIWTLWEEDKVVGASQFITEEREDNQHIGQLHLDILAARRGKGLARGLLEPVLAQAQSDAKTLLIVSTNSNVPAGEAFIKYLDAKKGMAMHTNQLDLQNLDTALMESWRQAADVQAYALLLWGRVPDKHLEDFVALKEVMNTAPFDDLELEPFKFTPEFIREGEASLKARGHRKWVLVAQHRASGDLAGYTETF